MASGVYNAAVSTVLCGWETWLFRLLRMLGGIPYSMIDVSEALLESSEQYRGVSSCVGCIQLSSDSSNRPRWLGHVLHVLAHAVAFRAVLHLLG